MKKIYCIWWDNGESYEDHQSGIIAYYTSLEEAEKHLATLPTEVSEEDYFNYHRDTHGITECDLLDKFIHPLA